MFLTPYMNYWKVSSKFLHHSSQIFNQIYIFFFTEIIAISSNSLKNPLKNLSLATLSKKNEENSKKKEAKL